MPFSSATIWLAFSCTPGRIDAIIVGTDRVTANGDVVNKIGTYSLAVLARHHGIPSHVAAPRSSIDLETSKGEMVTIEERDADEITSAFGVRTAPQDIEVYNPALRCHPRRVGYGDDHRSGHSPASV